MDDSTDKIITKLKEYQRQGLDYYQATQSLLKAGYTQIQIDDVEDKYEYRAPSPNKEKISDSTSKTDAYDKIGSTLLKDSRKEFKPPNLFTLWSPSTYGLNIKTANTLMSYYSDKLLAVLIAMTVSVILTIAAYEIASPQVTNNGQYCDSPSSSCIQAKTTSYGWPVHGASIKYEAQGRTISSVTDVGIDMTNFGLFFLGVCAVSLLVDFARTKL